MKDSHKQIVSDEAAYDACNVLHDWIATTNQLNQPIKTHLITELETLQRIIVKTSEQ